MFTFLSYHQGICFGQQFESRCREGKNIIQMFQSFGSKGLGSKGSISLGTLKKRH